jgi:hypothetical protein
VSRSVTFINKMFVKVVKAGTTLSCVEVSRSAVEVSCRGLSSMLSRVVEACRGLSKPVVD